MKLGLSRSFRVRFRLHVSIRRKEKTFCCFEAFSKDHVCSGYAISVFFIRIATGTQNVTPFRVCKRLFQKLEKKYRFNDHLTCLNAMIWWIHIFQQYTHWEDGSSSCLHNRKIAHALKRSLSYFFQHLNAFSAICDCLSHSSCMNTQEQHMQTFARIGDAQNLVHSTEKFKRRHFHTYICYMYFYICVFIIHFSASAASISNNLHYCTENKTNWKCFTNKCIL